MKALKSDSFQVMLGDFSRADYGLGTYLDIPFMLQVFYLPTGLVASLTDMPIVPILSTWFGSG